jgi:hypothetical protein
VQNVVDRNTFDRKTNNHDAILKIVKNSFEFDQPVDAFK